MRGRPHLQSSRLRKKRRKTVIGWSVIILTLIAGVWIFFYTASSIRWLSIKDVLVSGGSPSENASVEAIARNLIAGRYYLTFSKASIFLYPKDEIAKQIYGHYPEVSTVNIGLSGPHSMRIYLSERLPVALWCEKPLPAVGGAPRNCFALDHTAFIFAPYATASASTTKPFPVFSGALAAGAPVGQYYGTETRLADLLAFARQAESIGLAVSEFDDQQDSTTAAILSSGARFIIAPDTDLSKAIENVATLINDPGFGGPAALSKIDYIDLRFGSKIFYKTKK